MDSFAGQFHEQGYVVFDDAVSVEELGEAIRSIDCIADIRAGTRRLVELPWCRSLARRLAGEAPLTRILPIDARFVQCTLFVKSDANNWLVSLHQDLSIPVAERIDCPECHGWSEKEGELFVQPPTSVLEDVVAIRLHLDECDERNGALRVVPGSHRFGRLRTSESHRVRDARGENSVRVRRGGAMVMKPLLLHASSKATTHGIRRVLHFVFGPARLPGKLAWPSLRP
jgi:ectoine hydroxylase-related dioxygenase (phytanoyl-CoA dioxygenase family)